jgi:hypothetical protein
MTMRARLPARWPRNRWLVSWLVAAFLSHALIATGFMPGPGGLMLCPGVAGIGTAGIPATDMSAMDMPGMDMSHMDMSQGGGDRTSSHAHGACPFAIAAAGYAPPPQPASTQLAVVPHSGPVRFEQSSIPRKAIVPTSLPRGPPGFS